MIYLEEYFMGRDKTHATELTDEIMENAVALVDKINSLLQYAAADGVPINGVASGWRPNGINEATSNAAKHSKHLTAHGCDVKDIPSRAFARWCLRNEDLLVEIGLWMEDPRWTPTWVHLQDIPPGSGKRVYIPSTKPPLADKLPEQRV